MIRKTHLGLLALACALAFPALAAPAALAASCDPTLTDSGGYDWDLSADATVGDGENNAYDGYANLDIYDNADDLNGGGYPSGSPDSCGREDGDREVVYPTQGDVGGNTVHVQRKVYVPAEGKAFARWVDVLLNPTGEPITIAYNWYGDYGRVDGVIADETGDGQIQLGERYGAFQNSAGTSVASLWTGAGSRSWTHYYSNNADNAPGYGDNDTSLDYVWDRVTVPAGGQVTFMHVEHQNNDAQAAQAFARDLNAGDPEFYAGMSAEELATLYNWPHPDVDADTVFFRVDNCPTAANADQADLDRDAFGDVCDDDIDGDGLSNRMEEGLGTNPRTVDSDGDGVADGLDQCATRPGTDRGCPPATVVRDRTNRLLPNRVRLAVRKTRGAGQVTLRSSGRVLLPAGLTAAEACGAGVVLVTVKSGGNTVSTRIADLRDDCTYRSRVTFNQLERLGRRELRVRALFTGNDRLTRRASTRVSAGRP